MALPDSVATATVEATFLDASGSPRSGTVSFRPTTRVVVGETGITIDPVIARLTDGRFSVELAATDDADLQPPGWGYTIVIDVDRTRYAFTAFVPAAGSPHNLFELTPVSPVDPLLPDVKTVNNIGPDEDGNVDLGAISAPVTSVAGKIGAVTLVKADVGLALVDNTPDASKPVSSVQQTALDGKSPTGHNHNSVYAALVHGHLIADVSGLQAALDSKPAKPVYTQAYITSGNINLNTGSPVTNAWEILPGSPTITIAAVVGDVIGLDATIGRQANANLRADIGVVSSGVIRRWLGNGATTTPSVSYEGDIALYHTNIPSRSGERRFTATADDISGGVITFSLLRQVTGSGSALVLLDAVNPGYWQVTNHRQ
jgi:hypothetical protein